jgi:hypothetical protein
VLRNHINMHFLNFYRWTFMLLAPVDDACQPLSNGVSGALT